MQTGGDSGTQSHGSEARETGKDSRVTRRLRGETQRIEEVLKMRLIPLILVALLPSVMLASVTVSSCPADAECFVSIAREAMVDGNYVTAFAMYECALRRDPRSLEALAGRLMAMAFMVERNSASPILVTSR